MNSRVSKHEPKFFLVYCPKIKNFVRVNFSDPTRRQISKPKVIVAPTIQHIQKIENDEQIFPEIQFEPFDPFPTIKGQ